MLLVRRFVAGDTAEEALAAVRDLNSQGLKATLDLLGEQCRSRDDAEAAAAEIRSLFVSLARAGADCNVSVKLTQLGLAVDPALARSLLLGIADEADRRGNFVRIDMEGSAYTQRTLDLFYQVFAQRPNVGVVIQAYLRRSAADVAALNRAGARVRLCKGAYKEPPEVAFQSRREVDASYDSLAESLLTEGRYAAIATHDDDRIRAAQEAARRAGVPKDSFEFQMLYGVRRRRWTELAREGHPVRVYVPYGRHWFPYYCRRIRERKENLLFALRSIFTG